MFGLVRDYVGYGPCRLLLMSCLIISYSILYFAEPGESDNFLYAWSLQYGAGVGLIITYQQISRMFPANKGFTLGTFNMAAQSSALWPQFWNYAIGEF